MVNASSRTRQLNAAEPLSLSAEDASALDAEVASQASPRPGGSLQRPGQKGNTDRHSRRPRGEALSLCYTWDIVISSAETGQERQLGRNLDNKGWKREAFVEFNSRNQTHCRREAERFCSPVPQPSWRTVETRHLVLDHSERDVISGDDPDTWDKVENAELPTFPRKSYWYRRVR